MPNDIRPSLFNREAGPNDAGIQEVRGLIKRSTKLIENTQEALRDVEDGTNEAVDTIKSMLKETKKIFDRVNDTDEVVDAEDFNKAIRLFENADKILAENLNAQVGNTTVQTLLTRFRDERQQNTLENIEVKKTFADVASVLGSSVSEFFRENAQAVSLGGEGKDVVNSALSVLSPELAFLNQTVGGLVDFKKIGGGLKNSFGKLFASKDDGEEIGESFDDYLGKKGIFTKIFKRSNEETTEELEELTRLTKFGNLARLFGKGGALGGALSLLGKAGKFGLLGAVAGGAAYAGNDAVDRIRRNKGRGLFEAGEGGAFDSRGVGILEAGAAGAATGAVLGSIIPGLGTAVGAAVGGVIGLIGGVIVDNLEEIKEAWASAVDKTKAIFEEVKAKVSSVITSIKEFFVDGVDSILKLWDDGMEKINNFILSVKDSIFNLTDTITGIVPDLILDKFGLLNEDVDLSTPANIGDSDQEATSLLSSVFTKLDQLLDGLSSASNAPEGPPRSGRLRNSTRETPVTVDDDGLQLLNMGAL